VLTANVAELTAYNSQSSGRPAKGRQAILAFGYFLIIGFVAPCNVVL